jgi:two-component system sensor histidine kinase/response regulator
MKANPFAVLGRAASGAGRDSIHLDASVPYAVSAEAPPKGRLLALDDFAFDREALARQLRDQGHEVLEAETAEEALRIMESGEPVDLALLDHRLPGMSGLELLRTVRTRHASADLPIIMVTGVEDPAAVVEALDLGANDYVTKPFEDRIVAARVRQQLSALRLRRRERRHVLEREEFLAFATHDLRGPLTPILGLSSLLIEALQPGDSLDEDDWESLREINKYACEMQFIINDFLEFHALESGQASLRREPADLSQLARAMAGEHADAARAKKINLRVEASDSLPAALVDSERIGRVMRNFVSNAIKYNFPGGEVVIRTGVAENGAFEFSVRDNGPGLSEEDLARAFVQSGPLSNRPTGGEKSFGLGLVICRRLIGLHGGEVGARNNPEGGATFWFRLAPPSSTRELSSS